MKIDFNAFYVTNEKTVYLCWKKIDGVTGYTIYRDGNELADSDTNDFVRPYEFDNDHHTELFKPATRNWLYFKDKSIQDLQKYKYQVIAKGSTTSDTPESFIMEVYTD